MKGIVKAIIAGVIIILIGVIILLIGLSLNGWTLGQPEFEMQRYEAVDDNTSLDVDFGAGSIKTVYYDGEKIAIDYPSASVYKSEITESSGNLKFETKIKGLFVNAGRWDIPETIIYLPQNVVFDIDFDLGAGVANIAGGKYGRLDIDVGAGAFTLKESECSVFDADIGAGKFTVNGLTCNTFDTSVSAGKFSVSKLTCSEFKASVSAGKFEANLVTCPKIKASVSAGSADINVAGAKAEYTIRSSVSAGSCNLYNQQGTTEKTIDASVSAGSVNIQFSEN